MSVGTVTAGQARYLADVANIGYSQPERRTWFANADELGYVTTAQNADCSSLAAGCVAYGLHVAYGVPWGHRALPEIDDLWTGNLRGGLEARGFDEVPWNDSDLRPAGGFQDGDIILSAANEGGVGHVVVVTDAANDLVSEAWIAEDGSIDGYAGDTTGQETRTVAYASHPHTQGGRWTSCHRFNDAKFMQQFPEFAHAAPAAAQASTPAPPPEQPAAAPASNSMPWGIDVSSHQSGADLALIPAHFVIIKATEDDDYVNPYMNTQAQQALQSGKRIGFYHFARPSSSVDAQVEAFVQAVSPYLGRATLWLDWEANAVSLGSGWANAWLQAVESRTGARPGIYMGGSAAAGYDWSQVAARYPLWYAGGQWYSDRYDGYGDPQRPTDVPYWGAPLIHQYTEDGHLPGYGGSLDLNRFHATAVDWDSLAATSSSGNQALDGYGVIQVNGIWDPPTARRFRRVMNAWDYPEPFAVANLARYLNDAVGADLIKAYTGKTELPADGQWTSDLYRVFQLWAWNWVPGMPESDVWRRFAPDWTAEQFIDGQWGRATCAVLQEALNRSWADTGRFMYEPKTS